MITKDTIIPRPESTFNRLVNHIFGQPTFDVNDSLMAIPAKCTYYNTDFKDAMNEGLEAAAQHIKTTGLRSNTPDVLFYVMNSAALRHRADISQSSEKIEDFLNQWPQEKANQFVEQYIMESSRYSGLRPFEEEEDIKVPAPDGDNWREIHAHQLHATMRYLGGEFLTPEQQAESNSEYDRWIEEGFIQRPDDPA